MGSGSGSTGTAATLASVDNAHGYRNCDVSFAIARFFAPPLGRSPSGPEEQSRDQAEGAVLPPPPPCSWRQVLAPALLGGSASLLVVAAATFPGRWFPASRQKSWFFVSPVLGSPQLPPWVAFVAYYTGMAMLGVAWMWLLRRITRAGCATALILAVFALWSVPFVVGPPVGSDDAISYAAAGQLVQRGFDPYNVGIDALGKTAPVVLAASPVWREEPQPYGPLYLRATALAAKMGGSSFRATVTILRLAGLACLALLAIPLSALARRYGSRPSVVIAAVLCNPLVLVHLVGGVHNEAVMLLPLVTGVAVGAAGLGDRAHNAGGPSVPRRWGLILGGVVLCGVAATVKVPAILGASVLGWLAATRGDTRRQLLGASAATAMAAAVVVAIGLGSGLGLGWMHNLDVPQKVTTIVSPFDAIGVLVTNGIGYLGWDVDVLDLFRTAGSVIGLGVVAVVVLRSDRLGLPVALGIALVVLACTTPVVWAWYLTWGIAFLALRGLPVWSQVAIVLLNFTVTPLGPGILDVNHHPTWSALLVFAVTMAFGAFALRRRDGGRSVGSPIGMTVPGGPMLGAQSAVE